MIVFPPAKINVGLSVVSRRPDGYHDLESLFVHLPLHDILEVVPTRGEGISVRMEGIPVAGNVEDNLVVRAYHLVRSRYPIPAVEAVLFKHIPMGAGLGGGSSDGAWMIRALNELFDLSMSHEESLELAAMLGSDCPFFMRDTPAFVTGRGEHMTASSLDLRGMYLVLVHPGIHVSTPWAYSRITPHPATFDLSGLAALPMNQWQGTIINDFEQPVFAEYPAIREVRDRLLQRGAIYASMSGSGSACYGLYSEEVDIRDEFGGMFAWAGWL